MEKAIDERTRAQQQAREVAAAELEDSWWKLEDEREKVSAGEEKLTASYQQLEALQEEKEEQRQRLEVTLSKTRAALLAYRKEAQLQLAAQEASHRCQWDELHVRKLRLIQSSLSAGCLDSEGGEEARTEEACVRWL